MHVVDLHILIICFIKCISTINNKIIIIDVVNIFEQSNWPWDAI